MTPEGRVKSVVKNFLEERRIYGAGSKKWQSKILGLGWYYMPVMGSPFGVHGVPDFVGCYKGRFFGIEAKAADGGLTPNQILRHDEIRTSKGVVFVVRTLDDLAEVAQWMDEC